MPRASLTDEIRGWRDALSDRATLLALLRGVLWVALCAAGGAVGAGIAGVPAAVLGTVLVASAVLLARLRATGRP
jgi:hypothetical protein